MDKIKNETYPEEELREEHDPTLDAPRSEPHNEPDNKPEERSDGGGGEARTKEEDPPDNEEGPECQDETAHVLRRVPR